MKNAIIIHGIPDKEHYLNNGSPRQSNNHWLPWLKNELGLNNIQTNIPEMPIPYEPNYTVWKAVFEQFPINENTILIGHSAGAGFLIRYLSENNIKVGKVILVAPWVDPMSELNELGCEDFFKFEIDKNLVSKTQCVHVLYSTDDDASILETAKILKENIQDIKYHEFTNRGHFTTEPGYTNDTFPELLTVCLR